MGFSDVSDPNKTASKVSTKCNRCTRLLSVEVRDIWAKTGFFSLKFYIEIKKSQLKSALSVPQNYCLLRCTK